MGQLVPTGNPASWTWRHYRHPNLHLHVQALARQTRVKRRRLDVDRGGAVKRACPPSCTPTCVEQPSPPPPPLKPAPPLTEDIACQCIGKSAPSCCRSRRRRRPCQIRIANNPMTCREVHRQLSPGQWLSSDIVNSYLYLLCSGSGGRVAAASSFMTTALMSANGGAGLRRQRWTRSVDWAVTQALLIPVHLERRAHWLLAVAQVAPRTVAVLDPLPGGGLPPDHAARLREYMRDEMRLRVGDDRPWSVRPWPARLPRQANGDDCGVFVCEFARCLVGGLPMATVDPRRMDEVRRRICLELLTVTIR